MDYINREEFLDKLFEEGEWTQAISNTAYAMPAADVAPVVRCNKCKWFDEMVGKDSGKPCGYGTCRRPLSMRSLMVVDDFCSYGERRNEDD